MSIVWTVSGGMTVATTAQEQAAVTFNADGGMGAIAIGPIAGSVAFNADGVMDIRDKLSAGAINFSADGSLQETAFRYTYATLEFDADGAMFASAVKLTVDFFADGMMFVESSIIPNPIIPMPVGRWLAIPDLSALYVPPYQNRNWWPPRWPKIGEANFALFFCTQFARSYAEGLTFIKPSGRKLVVTDGVFFGTNPIAASVTPYGMYASYIFNPDDLDEAGEWEVYLTAGSGPGQFLVLRF